MYSRSELAGLYRTARVGLVTPLRDGMNLVAKEYVAAQDPDNPGVLILSRFAGAANELRRALVVNPNDPESVADAIAQALDMPIAERRSRHANCSRRFANMILSGGLRIPEGPAGRSEEEQPLAPDVAAEAFNRDRERGAMVKSVPGSAYAPNESACGFARSVNEGQVEPVAASPFGAADRAVVITGS